MPIPKRRKGEKLNSFISRCISSEVKAGKPKRMAAAICYSQARKRK